MLHTSHFPIEAVVTQTDKISPRGKIFISETKKFALTHKIPVLTPEKIKGNSEFEEKLHSLNPDLFVIVSYGKILPQHILEIPRYGSINVHPSLLPKYRGATPYQTALLDGVKETGVSIMLMDELMDHGPLLAQEKITLLPDETLKTLHDKLSILGARLLVETIPHFINKDIKPTEQNHKEATFTKLFTREDGEIVWSKSADEIERMVRALNPWPGTFTFFQGKRLKIISTDISEDIKQLEKTGEFFIHKNQLYIQTGDGILEILKLQLEGKKIQAAEDFIHGHKKELEKTQ